MTTIIHSLADERILSAIERNFAEEMACFGRALPGAELHEDEELTWFLTGPTGPNGVLLTNFHTDDQGHIETRLKETIEHFQKHLLKSFGWTVGPTTYPPDMANILEENGLQHRDTTNCMVLAITKPYSPVVLLPGMTISEVTNDEELVSKCKVEITSFGGSEAEGNHYYQSYRHNGYGPDKMWHHYIGWLNGKPVAVAAVLLHAGVAGIYGVGTLPEARKMGFGAALTTHAISEIAKLGYTIAMLSPSEQSLGIYQRIGFRGFCQLYHYSYSFSQNTQREEN